MDLSLSGQSQTDCGQHPTALSDLGWRSGRVPALLYSPPRRFQFIPLRSGQYIFLSLARRFAAAIVSFCFLAAQIASAQTASLSIAVM
jgi:hypothetical protein